MKNHPGNIYLERYAYPTEFLKNAPLPDNPRIITVIPCLAEPDLIAALNSLYNCYEPGCNAEVIVVINHAVNSSPEIIQQNDKTWEEARHWSGNHNNPWLKFHFIKAYDLPEKSAGVGLARKIGMDEAVRRLRHTKNGKGVISCFDADCECDPTYFQAIMDHFNTHPESTGGVLYFEHSLEGKLDPQLYTGITLYELHLRYLTNALRHTGFPYAFHTLGSTITVRSEIYEKQGGMNTRKAGEDFYFIQKIASLGHFHAINNGRVIPSPRISGRVPFGTGRALKEWMENPDSGFSTYNWLTFKDLKCFIEIITRSYEAENSDDYFKKVHVPESVLSYLGEENWQEKVRQCIFSSTGRRVFLTKLFTWFDGLKIIRILNFTGKHFYRDTPVEEAAGLLLKEFFNEDPGEMDAPALLLKYREIDKTC